MALDTHADLQSSQASSWNADGFLLVGTLGRGASYDALIRFPQGRVERLGLGDRLGLTPAVLVEVTAITARLETLHGFYILSLETPAEVPK